MCFIKKSKVKKELICLIKRTFVAFGLLALFTSLVLSIYGTSVVGEHTESLFGDSNVGWLAFDCVNLAIVLTIIGLMIEKLIKSDCHYCKIWSIFVIAITAIAAVAFCLFIYFDAKNTDAAERWNESPSSSIFSAAFGIECVIVAPVALLALISSVGVVKEYLSNKR